MKKITILIVLLVCGCASPYSPEQQAALIGEQPLCNKVEAGEASKVELDALKKRKVDCAAYKNKTIKTSAKVEKPLSGGGMRLGMSKAEVMRELGMSGYPIGRHVNVTSYATYEHWELCHDWLNKWNLSLIRCNPVYDTVIRLMFVDDRLESFSS